MENVEAFIDQLIDEKGYTTLDEAARNELKHDMIQRLMDQIDRAAINALPEDKAAELSEKLDDPNFTNEEAGKFMQESGVDLQQVALTTMLQFRSLYIGNADADAAAEAELAAAIEEQGAQDVRKNASTTSKC